ncbi:conserved Plasmodium protein, unknown function [Plasmodium berghei]|uniref:Uncharacterized protein n=2 Tax=Plasmodium berghei TaxID=5821 RepID=A0A509ASI3_PLABA|nr:conserved Plasmodium protein, unknown function [Plasmodium berghei ANKA]CXI98996.1 conserved Plasmodium protein, unknown function [Plasmodium berghei]SCL97788.1 conserved Plasmodium protein, unknown function [Plasmodium berghei]SCM16682.1 conserved Plasmodium protein, unknown function [Plasmodium berghei]SCM18480.1 conserved Plasmodium protein, unknown function [Plasmodium berghei]SCN27913.1 conserved Plasmodium protein, unknown function [Plasmodium berghei]|eukprot:XP_034423565.1 conserved Plasmodium protein, unknown function [Plasmodium berghei ANKA]
MDELDKLITYEYIREYLFKNNKYDIPLGEYHKILKCREGKEGHNKKYSSFDLNVLTLYDELIDVFRYNNYFIKKCEFTFLKISRNTYQGRSHISFEKSGSEIKTSKGNKKCENNGSEISTNIPLRNKNNNNNEKCKENYDSKQKEISYNCIVDGNKVSNIKDVLKDTFDALIFYMIDKYNIKLRMNHSYKIQEISNYSITNEEVFKFLKNDNYYRIDLNKLQYDINDYSHLFYKNITQFIDFFKYMKDIHSCAYLISLLIRIIADKNKIQKYSSQLFFCKRNDECISNLYINYVKQHQDNFQKIFFNSKLVNINNIIASKISLIEEVKKKIIHRKDLIYPDELVICSFVKSFYNFKPLNNENENNKKELNFQKNKILSNNPTSNNNAFLTPYNQDLQNKKTKKIFSNEMKFKGESIIVKDSDDNLNEPNKQIIQINIENDIINKDNLESTVSSSINNINSITDINNSEYTSNELKKKKKKNNSTIIDTIENISPQETPNITNNTNDNLITNNSKNKNNNEVLKTNIEEDKKSESTTKSDKNKLSCYEILKKRSFIRCSTRLSSKNMSKDVIKDLSIIQNKNNNNSNNINANINRHKNNNRFNNYNNNGGNKRNDNKQTNKISNNKNDNKHNNSNKEELKDSEKKKNTNNKVCAENEKKQISNEIETNINPQKNNEQVNTEKTKHIDNGEKSNIEKEQSEANSKKKEKNTDKKKNDNEQNSGNSDDEKDDNIMKTSTEEKNVNSNISKKTRIDLTYNNDKKKTNDYQINYKKDDKYLSFNKRSIIDSYEETDESEDTYDTDDLCDSKNSESDEETSEENIWKEKKNGDTIEQDYIFNKKEKTYNKKVIKNKKIKRDKYCENEFSTDDFIVYNNWDNRNEHNNVSNKKNQKYIFSKNLYTKIIDNHYDKYRKQKYIYDKYMRNSNYKERISDIINITNIPFWDKITNFSNSNEFTNISDFHYMINMHNINNRCKCNNIINDHMCLNSGNYFNDTCIFNKDKIGLKKRKLFENNQHEYNLNKSNSHLRSSSFIYNNKYTPKIYTNNELSPNNKYINYNDDDSVYIKHIKRHMNNIGKNKNIYRKTNSDIDENISKIKNKYTKSNSSMDYEINTKYKKSCKRINSNFSDNNWINKENYRNSNKSNIEMMGKNKKDEYFINNNEKYSEEYEGRKKIKRRKIIDKNDSHFDKNNVKNKQYYCQDDKEYEMNKKDSQSNHILTSICNKVPMKNEFYSEEEKQEFDNINIIQRINKDFCYLNNNDKINVIKILCNYRAYLKKILNYEYMKQDFSFEIETCIFYLDYINYNTKNRNNKKDEISDKMNNHYDNNYSSTSSNVDENNRNTNNVIRNNNVYYDIDRLNKSIYQNKPYNSDKINDNNFLKNKTNKKGEELLCNSFIFLENDKKKKLIKKIALYTNKIKALHQIIASYTKINLLNIGKIKNYIQIANYVKKYPYYFYYNDQISDEEESNEQVLSYLGEMYNEVQNVEIEQNKYPQNNEKKPFYLFK